MFEILYGNTGDSIEGNRVINYNGEEKAIPDKEVLELIKKTRRMIQLSNWEKNYIYIPRYRINDADYSISGFNGVLPIEYDSRGGSYSDFFCKKYKKDDEELKIENRSFLSAKGYSDAVSGGHNNENFERGRMELKIENVLADETMIAILCKVFEALESENTGSVSVSFSGKNITINEFSQKAVVTFNQILKCVPYAFKDRIGFVSRVSKERVSIPQYLFFRVYDRDKVILPQGSIEADNNVNNGASKKSPFYNYAGYLVGLKGKDEALKKYFEYIDKKVSPEDKPSVYSSIYEEEQFEKRIFRRTPRVNIQDAIQNWDSYNDSRRQLLIDRINIALDIFYEECIEIIKTYIEEKLGPKTIDEALLSKVKNCLSIIDDESCDIDKTIVLPEALKACDVLKEKKIGDIIKAWNWLDEIAALSEDESSRNIIILYIKDNMQKVNRIEELFDVEEKLRNSELADKGIKKKLTEKLIDLIEKTESLESLMKVKKDLNTTNFNEKSEIQNSIIDQACSIVEKLEDEKMIINAGRVLNERSLMNSKIYNVFIKKINNIIDELNSIHDILAFEDTLKSSSLIKNVQELFDTKLIDRIGKLDTIKDLIEFKNHLNGRGNESINRELKRRESKIINDLGCVDNIILAQKSLTDATLDEKQTNDLLFNRLIEVYKNVKDANDAIADLKNLSDKYEFTDDQENEFINSAAQKIKELLTKTDTDGKRSELDKLIRENEAAECDLANKVNDKINNDLESEESYFKQKEINDEIKIWTQQIEKYILQNSFADTYEKYLNTYVEYTGNIVEKFKNKNKVKDEIRNDFVSTINDFHQKASLYYWNAIKEKLSLNESDEDEKGEAAQDYEEAKECISSALKIQKKMQVIYEELENKEKIDIYPLFECLNKISNKKKESPMYEILDMRFTKKLEKDIREKQKYKTNDAIEIFNKFAECKQSKIDKIENESSINELSKGEKRSQKRQSRKKETMKEKNYQDEAEEDSDKFDDNERSGLIVEDLSSQDHVSDNIINTTVSRTDKNERNSERKHKNRSRIEKPVVIILMLLVLFVGVGIATLGSSDNKENELEITLNREGFPSEIASFNAKYSNIDDYLITLENPLIVIGTLVEYSADEKTGTIYDTFEVNQIIPYMDTDSQESETDGLMTSDEGALESNDVNDENETDGQTTSDEGVLESDDVNNENETDETNATTNEIGITAGTRIKIEVPCRVIKDSEGKPAFVDSEDGYIPASEGKSYVLILHDRDENGVFHQNCYDKYTLVYDENSNLVDLNGINELEIGAERLSNNYVKLYTSVLDLVKNTSKH